MCAYVPACVAPPCAGPAALWERSPHSRGRHLGSVCSAFHAGPSLPVQPVCGLNAEENEFYFLLLVSVM